VLLSWEGAVKVSDFGIAKAREASAATASTLIKGKVAYMSPEQANGEALDGRSDLFAVGVMLWELLTGRALFEGTARETLAQVLFAPIPRPSSLRPEVPADLEAVTMRLLERERSARYANAELATDDLASCADSPRNGHRDLARLLAARFPDAVAARASRPQLGDSSPPSNPSPPGRVTVRDDKPAAPQREHPPAQAESWKASETTLGTAASQSIGHPGRRVRRVRWPWIAAILLGSAAGTVALLTTRSEAPQPTPAATPPTPGTVASAPAPSDAASAPTQAAPTLTIVTDPPGATVRIDGSSHGRSPLTIPVELGRRLQIEAEHDGFEPAQQSHTAEREAKTVTITLAPRPTPKPAEARPPAPQPTARPTRSSAPSKRTESPPRPPSGSGSFDRNAVIGD
jgi:serine/threonine-protein kinase